MRRRGKLCPLLSKSEWHDNLLANGFSGAEICLSDPDDAASHTFSVIISTLLQMKVPIAKQPTAIIIVEGDSPKQIKIAAQVLTSLRSTMCQSEVLQIEDIRSRDLNDTICIFLLELEITFLADTDETEFIALKSMVKSAAGILWVTQGCGEKPLRPELGLVTGFGRNVSSESWALKFVELACETESSESQIVDQSLKVYQKVLVAAEGQDMEQEYMVKDGRLCIGRVTETQCLKAKFSSRTTRHTPQMHGFRSDPSRSLHLTIASPGLLDTFRFEDDNGVHTQLASDEVKVEVRATGLNFKDVMIALGQLAGNTLGYECGIVTQVGDSVDLKPGDRVLCCTDSGAFGTYTRTYASSAVKIPAGMPFCTAAALPTAFCTAYYTLVTLAHLQEGESVLISSGAGGIGQAAIQIAQIVKADVYTTVGTEERKTFLTQTYGIPSDHIFSSRKNLLAGALKRMTDGVDVILNSLSGESLH